MAYTRLRYHIVFATKSRKRFITPELERIIHYELRQKAEEIGARIILVNGTDDHVHIVAAIPPKIAVSEFVGKIKARASKVVRDAHPDIDFKWQVSFGAFTVSPYDMKGVLDYVANQKEHHRRGTLWREFEIAGDVD